MKLPRLVEKMRTGQNEQLELSSLGVKEKKTKAASEKQVKLTKNTKVIVESISSNKIWRLSSDQDHIRCCNGQQDS